MYGFWVTVRDRLKPKVPGYTRVKGRVYSLKVEGSALVSVQGLWLMSSVSEESVVRASASRVRLLGFGA